MAVSFCRLWPGALVALAFWGCQASPTKVATLESQNRALAEQNRAQLAEIENLKIHARGVQDKLLAAEAELARNGGRPASEAPAAASAPPAATSVFEAASQPSATQRN
jgi:hypothetical protein